MTTPAIPAWQESDLETLSSSGQLYGLSPTVVGSIDQAESSGSGGGINSSGYGGWFGLGENSTYPGGTVTPALLSSTSESSFISQAKIAASEFASLLTKYGNPTSAEEAYQSGSPSGPTEGSNILDANLGTSPALTGAAGTNQATLTSLNKNPFDLFGVPGTLFGAGESAVAGSAGAVGEGIAGGLAALAAPLKNYLEDAALVVLGIIVIIVGMVVIAHATLDVGKGAANTPAGTAGAASFGASAGGRRRRSPELSSAPERQYGGSTDARPARKALPAAGQTSTGTSGMGSELAAGVDALAV